MKLLSICFAVAVALVTPVVADEGNVAGAEDAKPRMQPLLNIESVLVFTKESTREGFPELVYQ